MSKSQNLLKKAPKWQLAILVLIASIILGLIGYIVLKIILGPNSTMPELTLLILVAAGIYTSVKSLIGTNESVK